ncbi:bifunctional metallophosphatase/5'-nucleotidase [Rhodococcus coprophilus]|uniref:5prime nucleotidase n=1 Tax=Rhodococcus coprophilus TaxID=38310 RepID=A0A2X4X968_9NOCA|nr:bifunctional UDP-sugar hydrolase/5'-nucleotidase [Rhodococcus coprophilus]MBM7458638.1 5'-nucleotidase [Rhodococcus coprophilus]SQI33124.1 5prime nucleotidase [Rhodococcus coprophilus]
MIGDKARRALSACALTAALCAGTAVTPAGAASQNTVPVRMIAFGDLHGNLLPPQGSRSEVVRSDGASVAAGGVAHLAAYVRQLRGQAEHSMLYAVGDTWGSSPLESAMFHDEPTIELLNNLDVTAAALGNHELDNGYEELQRLRDGGCHPDEGCRYSETFEGARFPLLAANLTRADGAPAALPFSVNYADGIPVGVIGVLPSNTPEFIRSDAIAGLNFGDEIEAVDRTADILDSLGVRAIVLLYKGDIGTGGESNPCNPADGPANVVATTVSPKVDLIVTSDGDKHFNCTYPDPLGRPRAVVQGASHGRIISVADLMIDRETRDVQRDHTVTFTQVITHDIEPDPETQEFVARAVELSDEVAGRRVGSAADDITREPGPSGESALGNLVADAQLAAARSAGAQVALTNPGGLRSDLMCGENGMVTYGQTYAAQPFGNRLQVLELTGAQLDELLEQQFQTTATGAPLEWILAPSYNFRYTLDRIAPRGERIRDITIDGEEIDPDQHYRVVVNDFLAEGGDGFDVFTQARHRTGAGEELDALNAYFATQDPVAPPSTDRIHMH